MLWLSMRHRAARLTRTRPWHERLALVIHWLAHHAATANCSRTKQCNGMSGEALHCPSCWSHRSVRCCGAAADEQQCGVMAPRLRLRSVDAVRSEFCCSSSEQCAGQCVWMSIALLCESLSGCLVVCCLPPSVLLPFSVLRVRRVQRCWLLQLRTESEPACSSSQLSVLRPAGSGCAVRPPCIEWRAPTHCRRCVPAHSAPTRSVHISTAVRTSVPCPYSAFHKTSSVRRHSARISAI